jgi:hypothetical protein
MGWQPIPVPARSKIPNDRKGWPDERWTVADVPKQFPADKNIGLLVGEAGHGLIDCDLDCSAAITLAASFLPVTPFVHGRASAPRSHFWYIASPVPEYLEFLDTDCSPDEPHGKKILELRAGSGQQTIVPPSIHPKGEQLTWEESASISGATPSLVTGEAITQAMRELAAATLTVRHYPQAGSRHEFALALSGFLLNQDWDVTRVSHFVEVMAKVAGDEEWQDRVTCVETTAERLRAGEKTLGGTRLREIWGEVLDRFCEFLQFTRTARFAAVTVEADHIEPETVPLWPVDILEGDLISDLTFQLYDQTSIPPQFLREEIVAVLGALSDGRVGFPAHGNLPTRRYLAVISERAQQCKGESWERVAGNASWAALRMLIDSHGLKLLDATGIGSGQFLAKKLEQHPNALCFWDESSQIFQVTGQQGNTLFSALKSLFEKNSHHSGSFSNKEHGTDDAHLTMLLHSTRKTFVDGFALRNGVGDGLLSRFTMAYSAGMPVVPEWRERDYSEERRIVAAIAALIPQQHTVPGVMPEARERFHAFARVIQNPSHPNPDHTRRIFELVKVDILHRCIYSGSSEITLPMVERGIAWGEHQLALRLAFWPADARDKIEAMTKLLLSRLKKGSASARDLRTAVNVYRDGSHETFNRALVALKRSGALIVLGKSRQGQEIFGLDDPDSEQGTNL